MGTGTKTDKTSRQPNPGKPSEECVQTKETPKMPNGKTQMSETKCPKGNIQNVQNSRTLKHGKS